MSNITMPSEIDYTALSTFLTCRKKYYWRMCRDIVLNIPQTAPEFGRCIHLALDKWFDTHDVGKAIEVFNATFVESPEDDKRTKAVAGKLLQLYSEKYAIEGFKILETEKEFTCKIPHTEISLIGRIDKVISWDGACYVLDHKTTSRLGYEFFNKVKPNMQFDGYIWAATQTGYPTCSGVVLDALLVAKGLCVPAQLQKLTPLARDISVRNKTDIERYLRNIVLILEDIVKCYETDVWYENTESCCDFVECPYRSICKEDEDIRERIIELQYKIEPWSPRKEIVNV